MTPGERNGKGLELGGNIALVRLGKRRNPVDQGQAVRQSTFELGSDATDVGYRLCPNPG